MSDTGTSAPGTPPVATAVAVVGPDQKVRPSEAAVGTPLAPGRGSQRDPLDEVVERVRRGASGPVDALQVAALLEAEGLTDQIAKVQYGFGDVFQLADAVYRRLGALHSTVPAIGWAPYGRRQAWRDASHGLLYLLPSAVFPAVLAFIEGPSVIIGLVLAGGAGWLLAGTASWLAYQLLGLGDARAAGRVLLRFTLGGVLLSALLGAGVAAATGDGGRVIAFTVGAMAYQMSSMLLTFCRQELWLVATMAPAAVTGLAYAAVGRPSLPWALGTGAVCVGLSFALAMRCVARFGAVGQGMRQPWSLRRLLTGRVGTFTLVVVYTALSAAYLLHAQAPYLLDRFDIVVTAVPLMLGMGIVEWRARRFVELARALLRRVHYPREFVRRLWVLLLANVVVCSGVVAAGGAVLLVVLDRTAMLTAAAAVMAAAYAVLAGAYMLTFVLAGHERYGSLCAAVATALAMHVIGFALVVPRPGAFADTTLFLGSAVLLQVLLILAMVPVVGQVWRHA
jgi:hypothetical protein